MSKSNNLGTLVPKSKTDDQEPEVDAKEDEMGILIEEEEDDEDDNDDSSDGEDDESDAESDLSDDPLAEVDSDNGDFISVGERRKCRGNSFFFFCMTIRYPEAHPVSRSSSDIQKLIGSLTNPDSSWAGPNGWQSSPS
ncbi:hypothetical protein SLEP1_g59794 [Rubroshorea leprosula]|uniref:Uncharacterized protein n=1 Tax=Rubroshorea leprosula TaxID=152421 RepID=A0AAV5MUJ5_9ROSI|nr:hypothetical protein SLEP1_g59794 [Rubroshorea leprosula]